MNRVPISYLQTDSRWANIDYSASGESTTIGKSGCGPTCMAMIIATLANSKVTPKDTCAWSLAHGYKAKNQGTYYSYFEPQGKVYGISVTRLNGASCYGKPNDKVHADALSLIKQGYWIIACMGKGNWTSSGHFILWYDYDNGKALIRDPNSTRADRIRGDYNLFKSQVKYYFMVAVPREEPVKENTKVVKEEEIMEEKKYNTIAEIPTWGQDAVKWALNEKILVGDNTGKLALTENNLKTLIFLYRYNNTKK